MAISDDQPSVLTEGPKCSTGGRPLLRSLILNLLLLEASLLSLVGIHQNLVQNLDTKEFLIIHELNLLNGQKQTILTTAVAASNFCH